MNIYNLKIGEIYLVDGPIYQVFRTIGYIQIVSKTHCIYAEDDFQNIELVEYDISETFGFNIGYSYYSISNVSKHIKKKISRIFDEWKLELL